MHFESTHILCNCWKNGKDYENRLKIIIIVQMEQFHLIWISRGYKELSPTTKIGEMMSMLWQIGWYIYKYSNLLAGKKIISKGIQRTLQHYWTNWINWTVKYINITSNIYRLMARHEFYWRSLNEIGFITLSSKSLNYKYFFSILLYFFFFFFHFAIILWNKHNFIFQKNQTK